MSKKLILASAVVENNTSESQVWQQNETKNTS